MDKIKALALWEEKYGNREYVYDYAAQKMVKEDFEEESSSYSWTVDFIKPLTSGGFNQSMNMMICSSLTKKLRQDKSSFRIGNALFEVRKGKRYGTFALYDVTDRNHPLDVSTLTDEMLTEEYHLKRQMDLYGREKKEAFVLPDLGNIRKNVFDEHAPDIISEETVSAAEEKTETAVAETPVSEDVSFKKEDTAPIMEETVEPKEDCTGIVEPSISEEYAAVSEYIVETAENTPAVIDAEPVETTPVVEERTESIETSAVEETPSLDTDVSSMDKKDEPVLVPLSDEDEVHVDERDVLFGTMRKETEYVDDLRSRYHSSLKENALKDQTISTLASNCLALKDSLNYLNGKIASMQSLINGYQSEKENLEASKIEADKSHEEVIQSLNQENASLKSDLGKQYNDYEQLQSQYQDIYAKCTALEQEKSELEAFKDSDSKKEELLSLKDREKEELNNQIAELKDQIQKQTEKIIALESAISDSNRSIQSKEEDYTSLHHDYDSLILQKEDYEKRLLDSETQKDQLKAEKESLQSQIDSLIAEKTMEEERFRNVSVENDELRAEIEKEKEESLQKESEKEDDYQKLIQQYEELKKEKEELSASLIAASAEKDSILADKESSYEKAVQLNVKLNESEAGKEKLIEENEALKKEIEENDTSHKEAIDVLMKQKAEADGKILFITCGGDFDHYPDYLFYLSDTDKKNTKETILEALSLYPSWHRKDEQYVSSLSEGTQETGANVSLLDENDVSYLADEKANREKAMSYWDSKFGDTDQTTDFAGRVINRNHYLDKEDSQGWNYIRINSDDREYDGNILIANMRTLLDYKEKGGFKTNGQNFKVVEENGIYSVESEDYVTDPYNLDKTLQVTRGNLDKKTPIIYLFVKILGSTSSEPDANGLLEFYDLLDRTVRRTCSRSFIEMKTVPGKENYAFMTFDGSVDGAYKEVLDYALLLNSYRNEFKKEENGVNAIIVLDQVEIPYSYRHFSFEQMLVLTKDIEMKAISYEFIKTAVVNSTIKKTIHIGPSIIDNLPLDQSTLKDSNIGQSRSFSDIYNFTDKFYIYNFVYSLKKESKEENNN